MLFVLTGDVQIGKTRWLQALTAELAHQGVSVAGVLAPGVWREREPHEAPGVRGLSGEGRFEKLGIDNVLLPQGERIAFARRRDLALADGSFDPASQSASAQFAWEISDEAIAQVNAHFDALARTCVATPCIALAGGLLVVDELGRLELVRGLGLTSALGLLEAGPTKRFAHAMVVVRDWLCDRACERFEAVWGGAQVIAPNSPARSRVFAALNLAP